MRERKRFWLKKKTRLLLIPPRSNVDFPKIFFCRSELPKISACFCSGSKSLRFADVPLRVSASPSHRHTYTACALWAASSTKLQLPKTCALRHTAHATSVHHHYEFGGVWSLFILLSLNLLLPVMHYWNCAVVLNRGNKND